MDRAGLRAEAVSQSLFGPTTLSRALAQLQFVQADPIRAPARAVPTPSRAAGTDWPLRNRQLAIVPGTTYRMCLDVKLQSLPIYPDYANRAARILSAGSEVVRVQFHPTTTWTTVCSGNFVAPTADNNLQIGFEAPASQVFYVDNVRIERQACGTFENGCTAPLQCVSNTCVCVAKTAAEACGEAVCGSAPDGCGGTVACGTCSSGLICSSGQCLPRFCLPRKCPTGYWWNPDDCRCEAGLPR